MIINVAVNNNNRKNENNQNNNNNNNNNINEGIDVLLNEFQNNVNIMGTGVPMMGRKLLNAEDEDADDDERHIYQLHFNQLRMEILKYIQYSSMS